MIKISQREVDNQSTHNLSVGLDRQGEGFDRLLKVVGGSRRH